MLTPPYIDRSGNVSKQVSFFSETGVTGRDGVAHLLACPIQDDVLTCKPCHGFPHKFDRMDLHMFGVARTQNHIDLYTFWAVHQKNHIDLYKFGAARRENHIDLYKFGAARRENHIDLYKFGAARRENHIDLYKFGAARRENHIDLYKFGVAHQKKHIDLYKCGVACKNIWNCISLGPLLRLPANKPLYRSTNHILSQFR